PSEGHSERPEPRPLPPRIRRKLPVDGSTPDFTAVHAPLCGPADCASLIGMAETSATTGTGEPASRPRKSSWKYIGPGIVVAATGVGAGDLVATLIAGSRFGYALLWAAVIGTVLKIALAEAVGRWTLSSERTMFEGWSSLGRSRLGGGWLDGRLNWAGLYFGVYVVVWGFVYGAAAMTSTALPLAALFPVLDLKAWGMLSGVAGLIFVWFGGYGLFEKVMTACVGVMFVTVVGLAVIVTPNLPELL